MASSVREAVARAATQAVGTGRWRRVDCPVCGERTGKPDRKRALAISEAGFYVCWKCGVRGWLGEDRAPLAAPEQAVEPMRLPEGYVPLAARSRSLEPARIYLEEQRKLDRNALMAAGVGACVTGYHAGRVVIPVSWPTGELAGWVGRSWTPKAEVPYRYPKGMPRGQLLYHEQPLAEADAVVYIVEGVLDALHLWPNASAVMGKASHIHEQVLASSPARVVVVLDGDAWRDGEMLAERLKLAGCNAKAIRLPPGADPDEVPRSWLDEEARR